MILLGAGQISGAPLEGKAASEDSVAYSAEVVDYDLNENTIRLSGKARVQYRGMELAAERITYHVDNNTVRAEGIADTVNGEKRWTGSPVFRDADTELKGIRMSYNLETRKGTVVEGRTAFEKGYYFGDKIRRAGEELLYVGQGTYTTCDREKPHYHFASKRMKIVLDDKIIATPVCMYLSDIPIVWLPFYVFPIKKGRHSGMLVPRYGSNITDGRHLDHLGYYFAPSDYWDATLRGSIREYTGWMIQSDVRYAKRYVLRGAVSGSFERTYRRTQQKRRWAVSFRHDQTLAPDLSLRGTGDFVSDKDFWSDNSDRPQDRMNRTLRSYLSLSKRWRESGNSLDIAVSQDENLDSGDKTQKLPRMSFRKARKPLWGSSSVRPAGSSTYPSADRGAAATKWYQTIYYTFGSSLDHTNWDYSTGERRELTLGGNLDLSSTHKARGWLTLSPSLRMEERWKRQKEDADSAAAYFRTDVLNASLSSGTTLYGLFRPQVGALKAIRHVVKPNVSFSYGTTSQHTGGTYGWGGKRESLITRKTLGLRWNNTFQIKTARGERERKLDLAHLDFSTGYDFERETRKLSDLSSSLRIRPTQKFNVSMQTRHTFYDDADKLTLQSGRLTSLSLNSSLSLSGKPRRTPGAREAPAMEGTGDFEEMAGAAGMPLTSEFTMPNAERGLERPTRTWNVALTYRYTLTKSQTYSGKTRWIQGRAGFSPTANWRVDYSLNYNLSPDVKERITAQEFSIYRDLHCWEARIRWTPSGPREGYYFLMNIKELPDVKIERRRGGVSRY